LLKVRNMKDKLLLLQILYGIRSVLEYNYKMSTERHEYHEMNIAYLDFLIKLLEKVFGEENVGEEK